MPRVRKICSAISLVLIFSIVSLLAQGSTQDAASRPAEPNSELEEPSFPASPEKEFAEGRILVKPTEEGASQADLKALNRRNGAKIEEVIPGARTKVIDLPDDLPVERAVDIYENAPFVEYAEPDFILEPTKSPNDPFFDRLWGLNNTGQTGGSYDVDIDAPQAWNVSVGDPNTTVAVIDSGVNIGHPDIKNNVWINPGEIPRNGQDDDNNGYVDDTRGWDFINDNPGVYDRADGEEHGTHIAGTIAAVGNNDRGITGVNWQASIAPLKFLGPEGGFVSDAVEAIDYAVAEDIGVSNNSWGSGYYSQTLKDAIDRADAAGHLFVAAAGNGGIDGVGDDNDQNPFYPASYDSPNIVSVAATNKGDYVTRFSNYGDTMVDLGAPGVNVLSTLPGNEYGYFSGTSMAAPHVAGTASLIKTTSPDLDDGQIKARIMEYVDVRPGLQGKTVSGGRLNTYRALTENGDGVDPVVFNVEPAPSAKIRDRTPIIRAIVRDNQTNLAKQNIRLYLDGRRLTNFYYNRDNDRLARGTGRLSYSRHTVKIFAYDGAGNVKIAKWSFQVAK